MARVAVVLLNLGGPDRPESVEPFLFNFFRDPAIIGAPAPIRWLIAKLIQKRRGPIAREIYANLGGGSPILGLTRDQAAALERDLAGEEDEIKCFVCMRYWHPMSGEVAREVKAFGAEKVVLLPLYPQYSTTTTGSAIKAWRAAAASVGLTAEERLVCCYPDQPDFIEAMAELARPVIEAAKADGTPRLLFSAHGLPVKIVEKGDPYQRHVELSSTAILDRLAMPGLDSLVCYQSKVGPLEWLTPSTEDEIVRAGRDEVSLVVLPVAFVSDHSETLVELDIEYRELAAENGVPGYRRVPALNTHPAFIRCLATLVRDALGDSPLACAEEHEAGCIIDISGGGRVADGSSQ
jgi:ferrochelatase